MGIFDDLIPDQDKPAASSTGGGLFDDLVPADSAAQAASAHPDATDDARASRGFGRAAYLDGLVDAPDAPANPVAGPGTVDEQLAARRMEPEKESQSVGDLGKRFARGATEIGASLPEAAAVAGAGNPNAAALFADEEVKRAQEQIRNAEARLSDLPEGDAEGRQRILDVIDAEQKKIAAYQPLVDVAEGPLKPAAKDRPLFERGDALRQASLDLFGTPDPQFDDRFRSKLAEGAGSMVGFVAATIGTGVLGGALAGSAVNASEMYNRAIEAGATEEQAKTAAYLGSLVGTSEVLPIGRALKLLPAGARGKVTNAIGRRITDAFMSAGEEGAQEAMQEISNNLIEKGLWNPEKNTFEGAGESALIGAILGGGVGVIASTPSDDQRLDSPRLTEDDRASPIPNATIDDGKAIIEDLLSGKAPVQPAAPDVPEGAVPMDTIYEAPQAPERAPDATTQPEAGEAPVRPSQAVDPQAQTTAPAAPQGDTDADVIPVMDENGRETGEFVRVNPETGRIEKVQPGRPPQVDTAPAERPDVETPEVDSQPKPAEQSPQEEPRAETTEDLDQLEADEQPARADMVDRKAPGSIEVLSNEDLTGIETDAETFQYKAGADKEGVTDRLTNVRAWDNARAGQAIVFEYRDGRRVIADGHQRLGLAKRLRAEGQDVAMPVTVRREADGYTPEEVMVEAALKNIAESPVKGAADPQQVVDAAKVMRAAPDLADEIGNLPNGALKRDASRLSRLSDDAFGMVVNEKASVRDGAAVGNVVQDRSAQANILGLLTRLKPKNMFEAEQVARQAAAETTVETQDSLFGDEQVTESLFLERARVMDLAIKRLRKDKATFNTLLERGGTISEAGNKLNQDANQKRLQEDAAVQEYLTRQANTKGPISDALSEAARAVKSGADNGQTVTRFIQSVRAEIESRSEESSGGSETIRADERQGEEGSADPVEDQGPGLFGKDAPAADTARPSTSWIIRNKETGEAVMETRDRAKVDALNTEKYEAVPAQQHLAELNRDTRARKAAESKGTRTSGNLMEPLDVYDLPEGARLQVDDDTNPGADGYVRVVDKNDKPLGPFRRLANDAIMEAVRQNRDTRAAEAAGQPVTERTEAGEQAVIPGAEQSAERSAEARGADQRREVEARQRQSKTGTSVPQDDAGPLFDTQGDMFDATPEAEETAQDTAAPEPSKTQKRLTEILRTEWTAREDLPEAASDEFVAATKRVQDARRALADEFGEDAAKAAITEIEAGYRSASAEADAPAQENQNPVKNERIEDFGEKIGGARKDTARRGFRRVAKGKKDDRPGWMRRYDVSEVVADSRDKGMVGKWTITDTKTGRQVREGYKPVAFDTQAEAEAAVPLYEVARNHRVRSKGDGFAIYRVTGKKSHVFKDGFETREAAMEYMAQNAVDIIETDMRLDDRIHPALEEALREGEVRRENDRGVTPQDFSEVFGFRGVEFGNWNNAAERQHILNQAYDSFLDLAEIIGVPPRAISLNGDLALAFGARGHGLTGGRAHYERNYGVINLTKIQGAGALAHEWMHAVDHYFGRQDGKASSKKITNDRGDQVFDAKDQSKDYASHGFQYAGKSGVREEVREAFKAVMQAIAVRKAEFKEDISTRERIESRAAEQLEQKLKGFRDALTREESYGRKKAPASKAQLLKVDALIKRIREGKLGEKIEAPSKSRSSFPPMFYEPVLKLAEIYKDVRGRQAYRKHRDRDTGPAVDLQQVIDVKLRADESLADAKEQRVKERTVKTEFLSEAWRLDQGRASGYWASNHELIARAFESYVYDRLKDIEARNDFLAYEKHNMLPEYRLLNVKPYPEGRERADINAAFRTLFDTIQTEETDTGVRMYQRSLDMGPVASLTGQEIGGDDIRSMRESAQTWYRDNLLGKTAAAQNGWVIKFTNRGLRKSTSKGEGLLRYIPAIRGVIEEGVVVDSRPGRDSGTKAMHFIAAPVEVAGEIKEVVVAVREAPDGKFQYDLSWFDGGRAQAKRPDGDLAQSPISPVWNQPFQNMNIGTLSSLRKRRVDPAKLQAMLPDLKARLDKMMIRGVDLSIDPDMEEQGAAQFGPDGIVILIGNTLDGMHTVNHEAIHVLRQRGLFKDAEWRVLADAASARWMREYDIEARYPDLSSDAQIEEAIAEAFASHVDGRAAQGRLKAIFGKIKRFFRAMKEALAGQGIRKPEDIFEAVEAGEIGAREGHVTGEDLKYQRPSSAVRKMSPAGVKAKAVSTHSAAIPDDTRFERFRRLIQDRMLVLRRMTEATEKQTGQTIRKEDDPYYAEERYSGRVGYLLEEVERNYTKPIIDLIAKVPIKITDHNGEVREGSEAVSLWLMARHAKERNVHIASINDQMPDGGSGLTNAEADAILQQAGANQSRLDQIGALTDKLGKEMITAREDAGLLSAQDAHIWRTMYKHYVPLRKFAEDDMFDGVVNDRRTAMGRRFNVRGKEARQALGRSTEAFDPLATLLTQAMEVTVRAEKNRVAKIMYNFAVAHPNPAMYEISMPETQRFYNKTSGKVETRVVGPAARQMSENEMALKVDGKEYRITFKDPRLAEALGQIGTNEMGKVTAVASMFSRYFSSINTMLSPPFIIVNAFRDMMTAQVNLGQAGGDIPNALRKAAMRDWVKALRGSHRGLRGKTDTEYAKWFKEYAETGGRIHFWKIETPESESIDFRKRVNRASRGKLAGTASRLVLPSVRDNPALAVIETANMAVDNAVRLATYAEARRNGWSKAEAASLAKNLTVNFNRRGEIGATMNAWYPFANAAIQGSHVILKAMKARQVQKIVGGMILFGFANDLLAALLSGTDDDGELEYDQLPAYKSERNIIVATPLSETGYVTIPLPYGYNVFFFAGQQMGKIVRGVKSPDEAAGQLLKATIGAFSPISGETGFQMLAPTVLDFANDFDNNRDWLGRPIRPENPYGDYGPQSYKEYNASAPSRMLARGANTLTGGSPLEPGLIDVSPEYIDHFFKFMTGGAGRFAGRTYGLAERAAEGTLGDTEAYEVPLLRVLYTESSDFLNQNRYFEFREAVEEARAQRKLAEELGRPMTQDMKDLNALWVSLRQAEKQRKAVGQQMDAVYANDALSAKQRESRLRPLKDRRNEVYLRFNRSFIDKMGPQAE